MKAGYKIGLSKEDKQNMANDVYNRADFKITSELNGMHQTIQALGGLKPSGVDTSTNILAFTYNKGIYIANDTGGWYYWKADVGKYVYGGIYQNDINTIDLGVVIYSSPLGSGKEYKVGVVRLIQRIEAYIEENNIGTRNLIFICKMQNDGQNIGIWTSFYNGENKEIYVNIYRDEENLIYHSYIDDDTGNRKNKEVVQKNVEIPDGSITPEKTTFLENENKNLFNGVLNPKNIYLQGNDSGGLRFAGSQLRGKGFAVAIKPNTTYTIIKDQVSETLESNGYYNFKYGTTSHSLEVVNSNIENRIGFDLDGTIAENRSSTTDYAKKVFTFTSGANDSTLIVMVGLENEPYIEVLEGTYNDFQYGTYEPKYNPKGLNIYNKDEVNVLLNDIKEKKNKIICNNGVCTINFGKSSYVFQRNTKSSINLDTYMFTSGTINGNIVFSGTDIEAPIKEKNTDDFIGGVHGDEIFSNLHILVNGVEKDISTNFELEFYKLTIFVKSTLYHCNTSNECFTRYKKLEFENDKLTISNRLICLDNFIVERYTGTGLYSIYKSLLNGYSTNVDNEYYEIVGSTTESEIKSSTSKDLTEAYFYGNNYNLSIKALTNNYSEYYKGGITDFYYETKPRLKIYLDAIYSSVGLTINVGEELHASFEIKVI